MGLAGFFNVGDEASWVTFCFVMVALSIYAGGGTYSGSLLFGGLGMLALVPITIASALAGALFGGALTPVIAIVTVVYLISLIRGLGPISAVVFVGAVALILGA